MTLFSKRYDRALAQEKLVLCVFSQRVRNRVWQAMNALDDYWEVGYNEYTSYLDEAAAFLRSEYGVDQLEAYKGEDESRGAVAFKDFVGRCWKKQFLDAIEAFYARINEERRGTFQREVNRIFIEERVPWRMADGEFFQLDSEFLEAELLARTEALLDKSGFEGALDELREARNDLTAGDAKGVIAHAQQAFESTMKTILGVSDGNASSLIRALADRGFFDDLPAQTRAAFGESVLMGLPFMGNRLGRHGQGARVVDVPRHYGELAVHLAGSFIRLLVERHVELTDARVQAEVPTDDFPVAAAANDFDFPAAAADDDIPF